MPGDVGAVATLINTIVSWFLDPAGYQKLTREAKIAQLHQGLQVALDHQAFDAADALFAELRKLSADVGP